MSGGVKMEVQSIVTILDGELITKVPPSLRRTISADLSSKKWLPKDGKSPMKRIASFEDLNAANVSSQGDKKQEEIQLEMPNQDDVWRSIQAEKVTKDLERPIQQSKSMQLDAWSSILSEKANEPDDNLPPPYVHPAVVKTSASTLSEKSLEICTESLGSESGSDGLSSFPPPGKAVKEEEKEDEKQQMQPPRQEEEQEQEKETDMQVNSFQDQLQFAKYNYDPNKKASTPRSFPPVLPSLETGDGSPSLHMHSHRRNGKLVLRAISVPQQNYFQAERQDGRLLLTLVNSPTSGEPTVQEEMKDEEVEAKGGSKEMEMVVEKSSSLPSRMINPHRSALVMKRLIKLDNKDPTWSSNKVMEEQLPLATPPRVARLISSPRPQPPPTSFNAYEYFWRNKHSVVLAKGDTLGEYSQQDVVVKRGSNRAVRESVSLSNGCKESRRSLLIWHPYRAENYTIRTMI